FLNATTERVKETIARANAVPMEFYHTEFLEYSKETYEKKMDAKRNKRKRSTAAHHPSTLSPAQIFLQQGDITDEESDIAGGGTGALSNAELRRQIHIQSEQKRRAQIKDGFDELRKHLPGCNSKKMSKAALLTRTVQQIQHLKSMQSELLAEVERLVQENEALKKFQHGILQRQAMEKMYSF
ncbi:Myc-type, basic helix-loop-helix domain-containing protein, partial [Dichotomocladium elegans]